MTNTLRKLAHGTRTFESRLTTAVEQAAKTMAGDGEMTPLEVVDLVCDDIARHVQPAGRGRYAFPFNKVTVTFAAPVVEKQAHFEGLCAGPPSLQERMLARLSSAGCDRLDLDVDIAFTDVPESTWARPHFHIALARVSPHSRAPRVPALTAAISVTHGEADTGTGTFTAFPVNLGRGTEVRDSRHQLLRLNHVAFLENGDAVNQSVSRRHAHIELDTRTARPRVVDDNSVHGTSVIRGGRGIAVPRGSRGLALRSGDELVLGEARIKVEFEDH